jgi:hypothetical protein
VELGDIVRVFETILAGAVEIGSGSLHGRLADLAEFGYSSQDLADLRHCFHIPEPAYAPFGARVTGQCRVNIVLLSAQASAESHT